MIFFPLQRSGRYLRPEAAGHCAYSRKPILIFAQSGVAIPATRALGWDGRGPRRASPRFTAWFALLRFVAGATFAATVLLLATARPAFGVALGDIELRSSLGQPLRAWIPYTLGPGEWIDPACVRLVPGTLSTSADIPAFVTAKPTLQSQAGKNYIVLESAQPINELILRLIVDVRCGPSVRMTREYVLLPHQQEQVTGLPAPRPDAVSGTGESSHGPMAGSPAAGSFQTPAAPRAESPAVRAKANAAAAVPKSPKKSAGVPDPPRRQVGRERPVLRIEPTLVEEDVGARGAGNSCCFRLSYELTYRGPPPTEAERERLRQEMRDPVARLQALRDEADLHKAQLVSIAKKLENAEALSQQRAPPVRELMFYGVLAAIVLVLGFGAWLWSTMKRQRNPYALGNIDSYGAGEGKPDFDRSAAPVETARIDFDVSQDVPDTRFAPIIALPAHIAAPLDPALRAAEYRKAYILGRFPEIAAGNIVLGNPASVIEGARIFYQDDHNPAKAVELLRIALATHPEHVHLWLALFEILSLERMAPEFADLAERYHDTRDVRADSHWPRVAKLGCALEPGNRLYRAEGLPPVEGSNPNWLNSQLDMMGDVLALELRTQVLESRDAAAPATRDRRG